MPLRSYLSLYNYFSVILNLCILFVCFCFFKNYAKRNGLHFSCVTPPGLATHQYPPLRKVSFLKHGTICLAPLPAVSHELLVITRTCTNVLFSLHFSAG